MTTPIAIDATYAVYILMALGALAALMAIRIGQWTVLRVYNREFARKTARAVSAVQESLPDANISLEDEIEEVAGTLSVAVVRLRGLSEEAKAFEVEVRSLVERADAAQAAAELSEEQARKITLLLSARTEEKFKEEIAKLTVFHNEQMEKLRKSGTRAAIWTFAAGAVVGFLGNLLSTALMS